MTGERVLVTGATGFVGGHLVARLRAEGFVVRAALRRPAPLPAGVEAAVVGDLAGAVDWSPALADVDAVVHGAGIAHVGPSIPEEAYRAVNTEATLALARAAAGRVRRFVFLSSIRAQSGPVADHVLTEADRPQPTDAYGRSKLAAEEGLAALDLDWVALRPVLVYGAGVGGNMGALMRLAALPVPLPLRSLTARRSLVAVETLAGAVVHALGHPQALQRALIVADPQALTVPDIIAALRRGMGRGPGLVAVPPALLAALFRLAGRGDAYARLTGALEVDAAALRRLGFRPSLTTPEGLARLAASGGRIPE